MLLSSSKPVARPGQGGAGLARWRERGILGSSHSRGEEGGPTGFLARLLGRESTADDPARSDVDAGGSRPGAAEEALPAASPPEIEGPSVVAFLRLSDAEFSSEREQLRLFALEDRVMAAVTESGAGTYEGNYVDRGFFRLYASGPDAERLAAVITPLLVGAPRGSTLVKRNGPPGTEEERVPL